jgi:type II secretory pathway pseudopilin PulG
MHTRINSKQAAEPRPRERGWALLGLLLALAVIAIILSSSIVPNVQMQVQRDKELEMIYRGEQMSEGIARYYNNGALRAIQLLQRPSYGYLMELDKLRDGVTIGVREIKFVRPSAMIDPISSSDWEPVRARDPRIAKFLQAWAAQTLLPIPTQYMLLAAAPTKSAFGKSDKLPSLTPGGDGTSDHTPPPANSNSSRTPPGVKPPSQQKPNDDDDDDDDDEPINDPLAHLFPSDGPGQGNVPIVGVAPKRKGKAANAYYGLDNYDDWVFLFIPKNLPFNQGNPGGNSNRGGVGGGTGIGGGTANRPPISQ